MSCYLAWLDEHLVEQERQQRAGHYQERCVRGRRLRERRRRGHPLAMRVIELAGTLKPQSAEVTFDYTDSRKNIAIIEGLVGRSGFLSCAKLTMSGLDTEDRLIFAGVTDDGELIDDAQCRRLFELDGVSERPITIPKDARSVLDRAHRALRQTMIDEAVRRNGSWFDEEMDKLDRWAEDRRASLKAELEELDLALKDAKKAARQAGSLPEKLAQQREARSLESKRDEAWRAYDKASREVDHQKDELLDDVSRRLEQKIIDTPLFALRWTVI